MVRRDQPSLAADDVTHPLILLIRLPPLFGMPDGRPLTRISAMLHRAIEDAGRRRVRHTTFGALTVTISPADTSISTPFSASMEP